MNLFVLKLTASLHQAITQNLTADQLDEITDRARAVVDQYLADLASSMPGATQLFVSEWETPTP